MVVIGKMDTTSDALKPWITFAGCVLIVVVLYWTQAVIVPIALAALLTFVLSPPVNWLERHVGRAAAVLLVAVLVCTGLALASWGLARQLNHLADDLPRYRLNIVTKIADIRGAGKGGSLEKVQQTIEDIRTNLESAEKSRGTLARPVVVTSGQLAGFSGFSGFTWLQPFMETFGTAALVVTMVIFMLLERRDLRDRVIGLVGHGHVAPTTRAFDEASSRVSRQLLMQTLVNLIYGVTAGVGLYLLGVPYAFLWAALGAALRFIPYLGPLVAAGMPILVSLAALDGWVRPLSVVALFAVLELFTNLVLETALYAGAAGVSQVALLISVAFWTWLWGPLGLLMATPLTVCLVVIGKHVPGLAFLSTLMADDPPLAPEYAYYQRLLARDLAEAADLIDNYVKATPDGSVYDALMLPALNYAERDRIEQRLSVEEEASVVDATRELLSDAADSIRRSAPASKPTEENTGIESSGIENSQGDEDGRRAPLRVLGYPSNGSSDELALTLLTRALDGSAVGIETVTTRMQASDLVALVKAQAASVVCFADLPPSPPSKTRYLVKRLHAALPDLTIIVGRWGPPALADENSQLLRDAGADLVATTLEQTRAYLIELRA